MTAARNALFAALRRDLALVNEIPLSEIPDEAAFTLDQHLAFGRLTDAVPGLLDEAEKIADPDYSPAFQDEYQRLWHEAAATRDELRDVLAALLDHAERIQEQVPKSENWYAVRDAAQRLVSR